MAGFWLASGDVRRLGDKDGWIGRWSWSFDTWDQVGTDQELDYTVINPMRLSSSSSYFSFIPLFTSRRFIVKLSTVN